jgi:uncharacterized protein YfdQ (DUF2303 family)
MSEQTTTQSIEELIRMFGLPYGVREVHGMPFAVLPNDHQLHSLEKFLPAPKRVEETRKLGCFRSFLDYVSRFKNDTTTVFTQLTHDKRVQFVGVFDYHEAGKPAWGKHVVQFEALPSHDFKAWLGTAGETFTQIELARFMENQAHNIAGIEAAEVLELVQNLEAMENVSVKSVNRLDNGRVAFAYESLPDLKSTAKGVTKAFPNELRIAVVPYLGVDEINLTVRLRYKIGNGQITFWLEIVRLDYALEMLAKEMIEQVEVLEGIRVYRVG